MPWGVVAGAAIGAVGSASAASKSSKAAKNQSAAEIQAAQIAADEARFRPWDMSNAFGNVNWTTDANGRVSGSQVNPSAMVSGMANDTTGNYNNYQGLLSQYFQPDLQSGGNQIYNEWQGLVAPTRQTQQSGLFDALQAKGITGVSGYDPQTGTQINPMANSLFSSWAGQDQQMAAGSINEYLSRLAQLQAQTDTSRNSLIGVNELPLNNVLGLSAQLGGRNANAQGSSALLQGGMGAAQTTAQGQVASAANQNSFWQGLSGSIGKMNFGAGGANLGNSTGGYSNSTGSLPQYSTGSLFNSSGFGTGAGGSGYGTNTMGSQQADMLNSQW